MRYSGREIKRKVPFSGEGCGSSEWLDGTGRQKRAGVRQDISDSGFFYCTSRHLLLNLTCLSFDNGGDERDSAIPRLVTNLGK
jgi:hypothetical protein